MKFGQYELLERVAVGGMAEVYRGRVAGVEGFEKSVAIKRILPEFARDDRFISMMLTEARIHSALSHRNILQIHDLGISEDGEYFIVLEYVEGHDLRAVMEAAAELGVQIPDSLALHVADELAQALHFAHELTDEMGQPLGIIHRDVSPSNVLISNSGEVKLSDFGIAKRRNDHSFVGSLKGNLAYMSPEQARRVPLDRRTDVFSLGAVLFEMLTGHKLREITDEVNGFREVASGLVRSARTLRPDLPEAYEVLLGRALAADPADRFPDAAAFGVAIRELARESATPVGPADMKELVELLSPPRRARSPVEISKVIRLGPEFKVLAGSVRGGRTMGFGDMPLHPVLDDPVPAGVATQRPHANGDPAWTDQAAFNLAAPTPGPMSTSAATPPPPAVASPAVASPAVASPAVASPAVASSAAESLAARPLHQRERGEPLEDVAAVQTSQLAAAASDLDNQATPPPPVHAVWADAPPALERPWISPEVPPEAPPVDGAISMTTPPPSAGAYRSARTDALVVGQTWSTPPERPAPARSAVGAIGFSAAGAVAGGAINGPLAPSAASATPTVLARDGRRRGGTWRSILVFVLAGLGAGVSVVHYKYVPLDVVAVWFKPAWMSVTSQPSGAAVTIDGRLAPERTPTRIEVRRDRDEHILEVSREGSLTVRTTARFDKAVALSESVVLPPEPPPASPPPAVPPHISPAPAEVPEVAKVERAEPRVSEGTTVREGSKKRLGNKAAKNSSRKPSKKVHSKKSSATETAEK